MVPLDTEKMRRKDLLLILPPVLILTLIPYILLAYLYLFPLLSVGSGNQENQMLVEGEMEAVSIANSFISDLFDNNYEDAGEVALGLVRFNVLSNKDIYNMNFNIEKLDTEIVSNLNDIIIVNSIIEYLDENKEEFDVVFYEIKLLNDDGSWKVYSLEEKDPIIDGEVVEEKIVEENELKFIFNKYINDLSSGKYNKASSYLIGRAKKMHNRASSAIRELDLINEINDLEVNILYGDKNITMAKFNYYNNESPLSVLVSFYLTEEGWRIYNVSQL